LSHQDVVIKAESNGKPPAIQAAAPGAFRRAAQRHRAERDAWKRLLAAERERRAALADYEHFCTWGVPSGIDPLTGMLPDGPPQNGLVEIAEAYQRLADPAAVGELAAERAELPDGEEADRQDLPLDEQLFRALHSFERSKLRWDARRETGMSDPDLKKAIGEEFGTGGRAGGGCHYRTFGGTKPRFHLGDDVKPALSGAKLVDRVRILLNIPRPVPPPVPLLPPGSVTSRYAARPSEGWTEGTLEAAARKLVNKGEPLDHTLVCSDCGMIRLSAPATSACPSCACPSYWTYAIAAGLLFPPDRRPPGLGPNLSDPEPSNGHLDRIDRELDKMDDVLRSETQSDSSLPPWTSADLERELEWATVGGEWDELKEDGAADSQIQGIIDGLWPRERQHFGLNRTGGKTGCTFQCVAGSGYFWLGSFKGPGHKAALSGSVLIDRIRTVLKIPTPTEARKRAQETFREPTVKASTIDSMAGADDPEDELSISPPRSGWNSEALAAAMLDLEIEILSQAVFCSSCQAVRPQYLGKCGACGWVGTKPVTLKELHGPLPADQPVKRQSVSGVQSGLTRSIGAPSGGWDSASLSNAAEDLGIAVRDLIVCDKCQGARSRDCHPCPRNGCGSKNWRLNDTPAVYSGPQPEAAAKRGRGRPPGSKTRKAVPT
jgi:hypothetical protein